MIFKVLQVKVHLILWMKIHNLINALESFENDLKVFFEKFPALNWSSNQDETLG